MHSIYFYPPSGKKRRQQQIKIDAKGLACPQPVLKIRDFLANHPAITQLAVEVDNQAASENVTRFLESQGYSAYIMEDHGIFTVTTGKKSDTKPIATPKSNKTESFRTLIVITSNALGRGNDELGRGVMVNFLKTLLEMTSLWRICFLNGGVLLCTEGADALEPIQALEAQGVSILVCGGCLEHYEK